MDILRFFYNIITLFGHCRFFIFILAFLIVGLVFVVVKRWLSR